MQIKSPLTSFLLFSIQAMYAQWDGVPSSVNNPVSTATATERGIFSVTDGNGGAIMVWKGQDFNLNTENIYAQRKTANGTVSWPTVTNPVLIYSIQGRIEIADLVPDGAGGIYVSWIYYTNDTASDIYLQRLNSSGVPLFTPGGIKINTTNGHYYYDGKICADAGGVIIAWSDQVITNSSNNPTYAQIFAQRYNNNGQPQWGTNGVQVSTAEGLRAYLQIVSDAANGAFISFIDTRNSGINSQGDFDNLDIYAQHISNTGARLWGTNDAPVTAETFNQITLSEKQSGTFMISDSAGGFFLVYEDYRSNNDSAENYYAQRLNGNGTRLWPNGGIALTGSSSLIDKNNLQLAYDGTNGMVAIWDENDYSLNIGTTRAQRITSTGNKAWGANGVAVSTINEQGHGSSTMSSDGAGNYVVCWNNFTFNNVILGQKVNVSGIVQWAPGGVNICTNPLSYPNNPKIIRSNGNSMIVAWEDDRNISASGIDIYAAKIASSGTLINTTSINYITTSNGNWNNPATWLGNVVPPAGANVTIRHTVTGNVSTSCGSLRVELPGVLSVISGVNITILQ